MIKIENKRKNAPCGSPAEIPQQLNNVTRNVPAGDDHIDYFDTNQ